MDHTSGFIKLCFVCEITDVGEKSGIQLYAQAGDVNAVNAHLLYISTHHWEEAAYWFPALKRLTKL
jgi:hypothetical protein